MLRRRVRGNARMLRVLKRRKVLGEIRLTGKTGEKGLASECVGDPHGLANVTIWLVAVRQAGQHKPLLVANSTSRLRNNVDDSTLPEIIYLYPSVLVAVCRWRGWRLNGDESWRNTVYTMKSTISRNHPIVVDPRYQIMCKPSPLTHLRLLLPRVTLSSLQKNESLTRGRGWEIGARRDSTHLL